MADVLLPSDPGWDAAHLAALQPLYDQQAQVQAQMAALNAGSDFSDAAYERYQLLEMEHLILDTNIKTMQPPHITDSGAFQAGDLRAFAIDAAGGQANWDGMSVDEQASFLHAQSLEYPRLVAGDTASRSVGGGPLGEALSELAMDPLGVGLGKGSGMRTTLKPTAKPATHRKDEKKRCVTCADEEKRRKEEEERAKAEEEARKRALAAPGAGPSTQKAKDALARVEQYPGAAVVGVIDTKTGQMTYANSVPRDWEGPRPDGFLPVNGGHRTMYEQLTGKPAVPSSGGDVVAFTITDQGATFKSGSVNDYLHNNIDGPSWLTEAATPHLQREFGTLAVP